MEVLAGKAFGRNMEWKEGMHGVLDAQVTLSQLKCLVGQE